MTDTVVFEGPPITEQKLWPAHCVQDTWGSELHPELKVRYYQLLIKVLSPYYTMHAFKM